MKIDESLVERILVRAENSNFGLDRHENDYKNENLKISVYGKNPTSEGLAMCLVNGFHDEYRKTNHFHNSMITISQIKFRLNLN